MPQVVTPRQTFDSVAAFGRFVGTDPVSLYRYLVWRRGRWHLKPPEARRIARYQWRYRAK